MNIQIFCFILLIHSFAISAELTKGETGIASNDSLSSVVLLDVDMESSRALFEIKNNESTIVDTFTLEVGDTSKSISNIVLDSIVNNESQAGIKVFFTLGKSLIAKEAIPDKWFPLTFEGFNAETNENCTTELPNKTELVILDADNSAPGKLGISIAGSELTYVTKGDTTKVGHEQVVGYDMWYGEISWAKLLFRHFEIGVKPYETVNFSQINLNSGTYEVALFSSSGKLIQSKSHTVNSSTNLKDIFPNNGKGVYMLRLKDMNSMQIMNLRISL